jgi:pimeloyl-ACP methyl ester carboxylesterase
MREAVRLPSFLIALMPLFPGWSKNKHVAHTLAYDVAIMGETQRGRPLPSGRWTSLTVPTLVASGGKSPAWVRSSAAHLADVLPNAQHRTLAGQRHYVKPDALAPVLIEFLAGPTGGPVGAAADANAGSLARGFTTGR